MDDIKHNLRIDPQTNAAILAYRVSQTKDGRMPSMQTVLVQLILAGMRAKKISVPQ